MPFPEMLELSNAFGGNSSFERPLAIADTDIRECLLKKQATKIAASILLLGLVAVGCTSKSNTAATTTKPADVATTTAAPSGETTTTVGETTTTVPAGPSDELKWALDYLGVKASSAATGEDFVIGYANDNQLFPEATVGARAAVAYVNAELGGIAGHKVVLDECTANVDEDGLKCGQQFANNDKIQVVVTGTLLNGTQTFYDTLKASGKSLFIGNPVTTPDILTDAGYTLSPGSIGVVRGLAKFATKNLQGTKTVAVVHSDNTAGVAAVGLLKGILDKVGVATTAVPVKDTDGATQLASAMTAAGADKADVFIPLVTVQGCVATYDALKSLGLKAKVVTTGLCFGTPMSDHLKETGDNGVVPDSWYFGGYGYSYFIPEAKSGMNTYLAAVQKYGKAEDGKTLEYTGFSGPTFSTIMTVVKLGNQLGDGKLEAAGFTAGVKAFKGPQMLVVGPMACGGDPIFKPVCGVQMGIQQYVGGKWISVADGINGKPVDPSVP